ncbi:unnamed protein product [Didymodactylos carnosus]|uniref:Hint domain-containing protein n=1 Tax=Didymodactylos carnosus TaxID=1234261 RepID=A0A814ZUW7_9BILA|nr:unnamed protein product [Didymodactylos carnosus]CAF1573790.1 unnamed protein product [Didymodactylos carnosus]CAF4016205.1 unnamed protein product [Didymodactylos carnosus]CAF4369408.1 unnamed protein product [Didymodactylos carnosus]
MLFIAVLYSIYKYLFPTALPTNFIYLFCLEKCFNGNSTVKKENGETTYIRNLKIGDSVLVYDIKTSTIKWSPVIIMFIYQRYNPKASVDYLELHTSSTSSPLQITPAHSLLIKKFDDESKQYHFASMVSVGDELYVTNENLTAVKPVIVSKIKPIKLYDAYAPITYDGTIIADGFVASCYGSYKHENMHVLLTPIRLWYRLFQTDKHLFEYLVF